MNLVIVHYHLNRGGVSRVIQAHLEALRSQLSGQAAPGTPSAGKDADGPRPIEMQRLIDGPSSIEGPTPIHAQRLLDEPTPMDAQPPINRPTPIEAPAPGGGQEPIHGQPPFGGQMPGGRPKTIGQQVPIHEQSLFGGQARMHGQPPGNEQKVIGNQGPVGDQTPGESRGSGRSGPIHPAPSEQMLVILVYGGRQDAWPEDLPVRLSPLRVVLEPVALLDYEQVHGQAGPKAEEALYREIGQVLARHGCRPENTLLHVHNHALGKNPALVGVLVRLAEAGYPMLLQIHDFAEDFRPANYRALVERGPGRQGQAGMGWLYPQAEHLHYAVLNSRDRQVLLRAGVPADRLHFVPNPVVAPGPLPQPEEAKARLETLFGIPAESRYLLYPVRAIRRKNIGEAVLCSVLAEAGLWIGMTLAPLNPTEKERYERWKRWTAQHGVRCVWETGEKGGLRLADNLAAADALLNTSITEGFGMVFLESWLVGRPLLGRNLPEITTDFQRLGLRLPGMWDRLAVPLDWLGWQKVQERLLAAYRQVLADYQLPLQTDWADALEEKLADRTVDFGDLDEPLQEEVLERILSDKTGVPSPRNAILEKNPAVVGVVSARLQNQELLLRENAQVVAEHFSPARLGQQLWEIYQHLAQARRNSPIEGLPQPERILESFLDLRRFRLLRT